MTEPKDPAPAVTRAVRLLSVLADAEGRPLTLTELARELGIAKSSASNLCASLEAERMIQRTGDGYRLGMRNAELGGAFARQFNQVREFFTEVATDEVLSREVVQVAMRDDLDALYLVRHEGRQQRLGTPLGSRLPLAFAATGVAMLASFSDAEVEDVLRRERFTPITERSSRGPEDVRRKIARARELGYSADRGESFAGIGGIAVALPPWSPADPAMAIGVAVPVGELTDERAAELGEAVGALVARLTNPLAVRG